MDATALQATVTAPPQTTSPVAPVTKETIEKKPEVMPEVVAPVVEKKEDPQVSQRFAALARKEEQILNSGRKITAERQAFEAEKAAFASELARTQEEKSLWETNPLELLKRHGLTYDKLTQIVLNEGKPTADILAKQAAREELDAYRKQMEEQNKKLSDEQAALARKQFEETLADFRQETDDFIKANTEKYELVNFNEANEIVLATIEEHFQRTKKAGKPEILSIERACDLVERYLEDRMEKALTTKKMSAKVNPKPVATTNGETKAAPLNVQARTQTITNNMTTSSAPARPLTREERIKRAMALKI
jgi:hypothetical protein